MEFALVGVGGVLGAWARHLLGERVETRALDTLAVNVLGSFAFGVLLVFPDTHPAFFVGLVGFCGAFTTFSTFVFETVRMVETGDRRLALLNAVGTLVAAMLAVLAGIGVGSLL